MFRKYRILKWLGILLFTLIVVIVSFGLWFKSLIPPRNVNLEATVVQDLPYLVKDKIAKRGKILAVVTSTDIMGDSDKTTGYELTELARAYYVFTANGFEVDIASPLGGNPPRVIDDEDMGPFDFAFLNDAVAQQKATHTIPIQKIIPAAYEAVFFAGGKGAMFDFPNNKAIQSIVKEYYEANKVIGAVCHGPSALVHVSLENGRSLLENKTISSFTNEEELLLIPDATSIFPFLLEDKIRAQGAKFVKGVMYLEQISHDQNIITGQNPWSTWALAERMIQQLGYTPKFRKITSEENSVQVLVSYANEGKQKAKDMIKAMILEENKPIDRVLIAKHSLVAAMKGEIGSFYDLLGLVSFTKKCQSK